MLHVRQHDELVEKLIDSFPEMGLHGVHPSWYPVLCPEFVKPYFEQLCEDITYERLHQTVYPPVDDVFNWTRFCPPEKVKVVILGQDPYFGAGQANGRAFSVSGQQHIPPSLNNIGTALEIDGFKRPSHSDLIGWAQQGVLLLNTALTVRHGAPDSHADLGWTNLTDKVISYISEEGKHNRGVVFMLWGREAEKRKSIIDMCNNLVLGSYHPKSRHPEVGRFLHCHHFSLAKAFLELDERDEAVDWDRTERLY